MSAAALSLDALHVAVRPDEPKKSLYADQRGAVMMMGLFMATFLIGGLWYMIGVGDALVLHDRLQETADSVAFTSAAVHARGMNFIAAINVLMMALVALYLIMGMINDILFLVSKGLEACAATVIGAPICGPPAAPAEAAYQFANKVWIGYAKIMKPALRVMGYTQYGAAIIYPLAGAGASVYVGSKYKQTAISVSPSMIPGNLLTGGLSGKAGNDYQLPINNPNVQLPPNNKTPNLRGADGKIGLPVSFAKMNKLCELAMKYTIDWVMDKLSSIPVVGTILNLGVGDFSVRGVIRDVISGAGVARYCNESGLGGAFDPGFDEFWGLNGPKTMWDQAANGNDWMQVWAMVLPSDYKDAGEGKVAGARGPFKFTSGDDAVVPMYTAQAEFYFDCDKKWGDCNKDERAIFQMKWKVRLRRVKTPDFLKMLVDWGASSILSGGITNWLKAKVKDSAIFDKGKEVFEKAIGKWGSDKLFDWLIKSQNGSGGLDKLFDKIKGPWKDAAYTKAFGKGADLAGNPIIH